MAGNIVTEIT